MKKSLAFLMMLMLACTAAALASETDPESVNVYVSISDGTGALVMAMNSVEVTDLDADGTLTINDALTAAHAAHADGAAAYACDETEYGLSMRRLWGVENGGSYGYYLNNVSAWSLLDPVTEGDHVKAYAFTDLTAWSDTYCYFDAERILADAGAELTLTLLAAGFDEAFNPITVPVADAVITVNGETAQIKTDAEGKAVFTLTEGGEYLISAASQTQTLVPPVCAVIITEAK